MTPRFATTLILASFLSACGAPPKEDAQPAPSPSEEAPAEEAPPTPVSGAETWPTHETKVPLDEGLLFLGQPSAETLRYAAEKRGVKTVINLRTPAEMKEKVDFDEPALSEELGIRYANLPVTPGTFSAKNVGAFRDLLEAHPERPVLLHCSTSNRVGALWAAYLAMYREVPRAKALERGRAAGLEKQVMIDALNRVLDEKPSGD